MKYGLLMENHTQNVVVELVPDPLLNNQSWVYVLINSQKFYTICFYCMSRYILLLCENYQNI